MGTYQPISLLDINEMTMENLMRGPRVEILEDKRLAFGTRCFLSNKAGFQKYSSKYAEFSCSALTVISDDVAENKYFEEFDIDLGVINPTHVESLELSGDTRFPQGYDFSAIAAMTEVRQFVSGRLSFGAGLQSFFPKLQILLNFDWKANPVRNLDGIWPDLEYLHLQGFNDDLGVFAGKNLRGLFLVGASLKTFDDLLEFPQLEKLLISGLRKGVDLAPLAKLPALRNLGLHGKTKYTGWEDFRSDTVEILDLGWAPSARIFDSFPALLRGNISQMPGSSYGTGHNWELDEFEYPFASVIPTSAVV